MAETRSGSAQKFEVERNRDTLHGNKLIESILLDDIHALKVGRDKVH
jgi:hypothetical protein